MQLEVPTLEPVMVGAAHHTVGRKKGGLMEVTTMDGSVTLTGCVKTAVSPR